MIPGEVVQVWGRPYLVDRVEDGEPVLVRVEDRVADLLAEYREWVARPRVVGYLSPL